MVTVNGTRTELDPTKQDEINTEIEPVQVSWNKKAAEVTDPEEPWNSPSTVTDLDKESVADWIAKHKLSPEAEAVLRFSLENDQTIPVKEQSFLGLLCAIKGGALSDDLSTLTTPSEYWTETEIFRCAHGNQELAWKLRETIEKRGGKFERFPVKEVDMSATPPSVTLWNPVTGKRSASRTFDWVVVAVPPSVYNDIDFLGLSILDAKIGYGDATKLLSRVDRRFWMKKGKAPSGADDRLGAFWEATDNQIAHGNLEFDLSLFSGGPNSANIIPARRKLTTVLQSDIDAVFPGYSTSLQKPPLPVDWPSEDWIKIGYSCPKVGQVMKQGQFLNQLHTRLVFGGEHTSMAFFGYMEGALRSGLRAASQIVGHRLPA